jgi:hypothetical protein
VYRERRRSFGARPVCESEKRSQFAVDVVELAGRGGESGGKTGLGLTVIAAVHHQDAAELGSRAMAANFLLDALLEFLRIEREVDGVPVAVAKVDREDARTVRRLPMEGHVVDIRADTTPESRLLESASGKDLGKLAHVAELVGHIAHRHHRAEGLGVVEAALEIPNQGLPRNQPFVGKYEPGADQEPPGPNEGGNSIAGVRAHGEIIVEYDGLAVERKPGGNPPIRPPLLRILPVCSCVETGIKRVSGIADSGVSSSRPI